MKTIEEISNDISTMYNEIELGDYLKLLEGFESTNRTSGSFKFVNKVEKYSIKVTDSFIYDLRDIDKSYLYIMLEPETKHSAFDYIIIYNLVIGNKFVNYIADVCIKNQKDTVSINTEFIKRFGNALKQDAELLSKYNFSSINVSYYIFNLKDDEIDDLIILVNNEISKRLI